MDPGADSRRVPHLRVWGGGALLALRHLWVVAMCGMAVALHSKLDVVAYTGDEWDGYD